MPHTVANARQSPLVPDSETRGRQQVRAGLTKQRSAMPFLYGSAIWEVLVKGHGSTKATAITMGNRDRSLLRREVLDGSLTLKELLQADARALAAFGEFLTDTFGDSTKSKAQIAREKLPELLATILEAVAEAEHKK